MQDEFGLGSDCYVSELHSISGESGLTGTDELVVPPGFVVWGYVE
jgi:hypothetical protein